MISFNTKTDFASARVILGNGGAPQILPSVEFDVNTVSDDLNIWYVAVTRAKKVLSLPKQWQALVEMITQTMAEMANDDAEVAAKQILFQTFPIPLIKIKKRRKATKGKKKQSKKSRNRDQ